VADRIRGLTLALLAVLALVVAIDNGERQLANPDEGRYSEISREMAASGDWVTPRLNGLKYFEKPPLQYWGTAIVFNVFGESEYTARLYVILSALFTLLIAAYTASRLASRDAGLLTALVLMGSPYFTALGGIVTLDTGLTLFTTLTLCAFLLAQTAQEARARRRWMLVSWAAMALAVLSKGLVGIVFPAAALFLHCVVSRDLRPLARLEWLRGLPLFLMIAAPWFIAVSLANPEFAHFFFVHEHFERFLTTEHRRVEPWWFFIPILFLGFLPWMFFLLPAVARAWRRDGAQWDFHWRRYLILWAGFIVVFFSASGSKLSTYILPAFPALAIVIAEELSLREGRSLAKWLAPVALVALFGAFVAWNAPDRAADEWTRGLYENARPWAIGALAVLFVGAAISTAYLRRGRKWAGIVALAVATLVFFDCTEDGYEEMSPRQSGHDVAEAMKPWLKPATRIYSVRHYDQTVPFYIKRTMILVDYVDEFELGQKAEPARGFPTVAGFRVDWLRDGDAIAIMQPGSYEALKTEGLPMQLLHEDPRRVLVRKP
jgi:4-amino-4-deoxy-L-arabinose transferase-like glycosyltransferase